MGDPLDSLFVPKARTTRAVIKGAYQRWLPPFIFICNAVWLGCVFFLKPPRPPVGAYIAGLACLAVIVTIWPPESNGSKAVWLAIFFSLTLLELHTLYQERAENQQQQAEARKEEQKAFKSIADGITTSIRANQQAFSATMDRMKDLTSTSLKNLASANRSLSISTGGDSKPGFSVQIGNGDSPTDASAQFNLFVDGNYPLRSLNVNLSQSRCIFDSLDPVSALSGFMTYHQIMDTYSSGHGWDSRTVAGPYPLVGTRAVFFGHATALNGSWHFLIKFRREQGRWEWRSITFTSSKTAWVAKVLADRKSDNFPVSEAVRPILPITHDDCGLP